MAISSHPAIPGDPHRAFEQLSRRAQIAGMRQLAHNALAAYDLPPFRLTLIAHLFNTTFRVDTSAGQRYMLRINRAGTPTVQTVGAELAWLAALRRDTALEVPSPVPTLVGSLLTVAEAPGVPRSHICVLFRWLPGRRMHSRLTPEQMEHVGELMGQLQNHATHWQRPPDFARGRVDYPLEGARWLPDPLATEVIANVEALVADALSPREAAEIKEALLRVQAAEQALGKGADAFGLIHADLHYGNLLFEGNTVRAIDFDDCGFGPLLYDPAVMLSEILDWDGYSALREGLIAGYRRVRPLEAEHEAHLDAFIALRTVQNGMWILEWRKHPALREDWASQARRVMAPLKDYLAKP